MANRLRSGPQGGSIADGPRTDALELRPCQSAAGSFASLFASRLRRRNGVETGLHVGRRVGAPVRRDSVTDSRSTARLSRQGQAGRGLLEAGHFAAFFSAEFSGESF